MLVRLDMKQTELAAKIGVNEMWLSRRLRGAQPIDLNDLQLIAEALNVEVSELLPRSNEGRIITTGSGINGRSAALAKRLHQGSTRTRTKRTVIRSHLKGRPQKGTAASASTRPPTQRRPTLITRAG